MFARVMLAAALLGSLAANAWAGGTVTEVHYPAGTEEGTLQFAVTYRLWVPDDAKTIRGVIIHQHGCGSGAGEGGKTAADDLQWQALAAKWDCALLGPSIEQPEGSNCRLWCDPNNGSADRLLEALDDLAEKTGHAELKTVPWCLWGHSGGAFWASIMHAMYPERIVAIWFRSGTALNAWEKGEVKMPESTPAMFEVPMMLNPGIREEGDNRFGGLYSGSVKMFYQYRDKGAPIGFAVDPKSHHDCGTSRYLAIPFFDHALAARLPEPGSETQTLRKLKLDGGTSYRAAFRSADVAPLSQYEGDPREAVFLQNEDVARAYSQYITTGYVEDTTPPPSPTNLEIADVPNGQVKLTWDAPADLESGLAGFLIQQGGKTVAKLPEGLAERKLFQGISYHDTPNAPFAKMEWTGPKGDGGEWKVVAVNGAGLESE